jgi:hypothetical protein
VYHSAGLLSSESDFAPPQARTRAGANTITTEGKTPVYVPVTMEAQEPGGTGKRIRASLRQGLRVGRFTHTQTRDEDLVNGTVNGAHVGKLPF